MSMNRIARILSIALIGVFLLAVAAPAMATESSSEDTTTTSVEAVPIAVGDQPAVVIPPVDAEAEEQPWTSRFMYPLIGVLAVLFIGGYAVAYNRSVRRRYSVVD
jgi:hypothetical protein